jgi:hypothetical protein
MRLLDNYLKLEVNQRLYSDFQTKRSLLLVFFLIWLWAISYDLTNLFKAVYETLIGKAFLLLLFSLATNFAVVFSNQIINSITAVDPSKFPHTVALLSILCIPFLVAIGLGLLYALLLIASPLFFMFHALPDDKSKEVLFPGYKAPVNVRFHKTTRLVQAISFALFFGIAFSLSQKISNNYENFLTETARSFLFRFEMYPKAQCALQAGQRAAFVIDESILIASQGPSGNYVFSTKECKFSIE